MKKQSPLKRIFAIRGMGGALTAFGLIIIYIAFGIINPAVFSGQNVMNLLRSMSKYLIIGIGQSYVLITGNIDLSIGSVVGMSAMIAATLMTMGVNPVVAILITFVCCMIIGVLNGILVGKWKLPPFIATLGTMFVARGVAYMVNTYRQTYLCHRFQCGCSKAVRRQRSKDHHQDLSGQCILFFCGRIDPLRSGRDG